MSATVEKIKERLSITDVVGSYVELKPAGSSLRARCPFHQEKTPSFFVSPTRGTYYCFGCGEKGDIFSFVEKFEGVDFSGALRLLGERAGVSIEFERPERKEERDRLFEIIEETTRYYEMNLKDAPTVLAYLKERGVSDVTRERFHLGYALPEWDGLLNYLIARQFSVADIEKAGLIKRGKEKHYDRFRGRIMFPINDRAGRAIAFSGRFFESMPGKKLGDGEEEAKYINSPETPLFEKSRVLYGYDKARESMRRADCAMVVEGQMDLLMSHQAGYTNAVAVSGTALTEHHLLQIERLTKRLILCFDADEAGSKAALRGASLALSMGFDVKVVAIAEGKDPADLVKEDPELLKVRVRSATHVIDYLLERLSQKGYDSRKFRMVVGSEVLPFVARVPGNIERAHFVEKVSRVLRVPESAVVDDLQKVRVEKAPGSTSSGQPVKSEEPKTGPPRIAEKIMGFILWQEAVPQSLIDTKKLHERLNAYQLGEEIENKEKLAFEAETSVGTATPEVILKTVEELFYALDESLLRGQLEEATASLRAAEVSENKEDIDRFIRECSDLSLKLKKFHPITDA